MRVYLAAGLTERAGDRFHDAAVLTSPSAEILLKHRSINVLLAAQDLYSTGDSLAAVETPLGVIG